MTTHKSRKNGKIIRYNSVCRVEKVMFTVPNYTLEKMHKYINNNIIQIVYDEKNLRVGEDCG
jgi:hypothetical protein